MQRDGKKKAACIYYLGVANCKSIQNPALFEAAMS